MTKEIIEILKLIINFFEKPKPEFLFEYKIPSSSTEDNDYCQFRYSKENNIKTIYFRLGINNKGLSQINNADVMVEKVEEIKEGSRIKMIPFNKFFLHWANEKTDDSKSIHNETPVFIDLLYVRDSENFVSLFPKEKHAGSGINSIIKPGKWIITVKLLGENINPVKKEIKIDFNGVWNEIKILL